MGVDRWFEDEYNRKHDHGPPPLDERKLPMPAFIQAKVTVEVEITIKGPQDGTLAGAVTEAVKRLDEVPDSTIVSVHARRA